MGDIGRDQREVEYEPIEIPAELPSTPVPAEPERAPEPQKVPARI